MAAKKTPKKTSKSPKSSEPTITKSAFIRQHPKDTPASKVVELAKKAGIKFDVNLVYVVRSADAKKVAKLGGTEAEPTMEEYWDLTRPGRSAIKEATSAPKTKTATKGKSTAKVQAVSTEGSRNLTPEQQFVRLIMELGVAKATVLFRQTLAQMRGIAG